MGGDIEGYLDWRRGLTEEDYVHSYQGLKIMEDIKFTIATVADPVEKLSAIEEEASKWIS